MSTVDDALARARQGWDRVGSAETLAAARGGEALVVVDGVEGWLAAGCR